MQHGSFGRRSAVLAALALPAACARSGDPSAVLPRADADMVRVLQAMTALDIKPVERLSVPQARAQPSPADAVRVVLQQQGRSAAPRPLPVVRDLQVPGAAAPLPARLYGPAPSTRGTRPPLILYWHGGGFVIADLNTYDASARALAADTGAMVLSLHYRQAPEHRFPAAHEDALAAYAWAVANAPALGADARRLAVAGESAGGNLAITTAIAARDRNLPAARHMALVYPLVGTDTDTPSYQENARAVPLSRAGVLWFVDKATSGTAQLRDPRLDVIGQAELRGLPPATIVTAGLDPLRSDGERLAAKLQAAGVAASLRNWPGVTHEFFGMAPAVAAASQAQAFMAERLRQALYG